MTDRIPLTVLLVDDQKFVGMAVGRLLSSETDIALHCCHAGADALAHAARLEPRVILQDLVMPDVDGLTLVGLYRSNPATAATPVIVLSGNDDASAKARAMAAGANDFLVKLPDRETLVACIRRHADLSSVAAVVDASRIESSSNDTFDPAELAALGEGDPDGAEMLVALIDQFLQEAASLVDQMTRAIEQGDARLLKAAAHSLKGSSLTVGARRLAGLGAEAEQSADGMEGSVLGPSFVPALREELAQVRAAAARQIVSLRACPVSRS